ncbi:hypothetical protein [Photobacterium atrarenae]|uniref:Uncharacterized protein n=1 Tax=Photobacterium atrarenae TaxID=865757 RepID=A0ABY5GM82_9GAMM|nr:hypothetical protein [Photobacterium atrarenae]UTV29413.1 hypothetical protein NNL38_20545 [Photobacterium atrarenae]
MKRNSTLKFKSAIIVALVISSLPLMADEHNESNHIKACEFFLESGKIGEFLKSQLIESGCNGQPDESAIRFCAELKYVSGTTINEILLPYYVKRVSEEHCTQAGEYYSSMKGKEFLEFAFDYAANPDTAYVSDSVLLAQEQFQKTDASDSINRLASSTALIRLVVKKLHEHNNMH